MRKLIRFKHTQTLTKLVFVHQDKVPAHNHIFNDNVRDCGVELLYHPPIWRLPGKQHLAVNHYRSDDEDISGVDDYFVESEASSFSNEIQTLQHRWKC